MRGSASPKGEARREAPPRQSEANAAAGTLLTRVRVMHDDGWGGGGGVTKN
jgi:hypothetical protein